jgi:hypothetical protein
MTAGKSFVRPLLLLLPVAAWGGMLLTPPLAASKDAALRQLTLASMRLAFEVPAGWVLDDTDAETLHLVQLYGPWTKNLEHPKITLYYYGRESAFRSKDDYVESLMAKKRGEDDRTTTLGEAKVGGLTARLVSLAYVDTLGAYSTRLRREPVKELLVLLDAPQGGFYVFQFWAAQSIFKSNYPAFERLLESAQLTSRAPQPRRP